MKLVIDNITLRPDQHQDEIGEILSARYGISLNVGFRVLLKSLDARKKSDIVYRYRVLVDLPEEIGRGLVATHKEISEYTEPPAVLLQKIKKNLRVIIVGAGPAGLFSALRLVDSGVIVTLVEQGKPVEDRMKDIDLLETQGILNLESNVLFGEGGAGAYSDGKLTTRIDKPEIAWFYERLVDFGAPSEILYEAKPHTGTDRLRSILINIRKHLIASGCEIIFSEKMCSLIMSNSSVVGIRTASGRELRADAVLLATGHSARDVYQGLIKQGIALEKKGFAIGIRIEHPADLINSIQYGKSEYRGILPTAEYFLTHTSKETGRGVYSFCMCPGGSVINSSSEKEMLCVNGMSYSARDSAYSNSAIVVSVKPEDTGRDIFGGIALQREIESKAYQAGGGSFVSPCQRVTSFLKNRQDTVFPAASYKPNIKLAMVNDYLPDWISGEIRSALKTFDNKMRGFISDQALLIGAETRTSSPIRISRGRDFQSISHKCLYPAGEGSGYSGGIVSSVVDGIRAADAVIAANKA